MHLRAFTLRELIAVIIIVIILLALLLPAAQRSAPQAARRVQCGNNIKQLVLSLQNYADTIGVFPAGAEARINLTKTPQASWGPSWLVATLPFCEQRPLFDSIVKAAVASGARLRYLFCPASPLFERQKLGGADLIIPSYAGIMGANIDAGPAPKNAADPLRRIVNGRYGGVAAGNGMLPINERLTFAACKDGTANVILVGEVSDFYYDDRGQKYHPALSVNSAGDSPNNAAGWIAGTILNFKITDEDSPAVPAANICNLITLEHPVGTNNQKKLNDTHPNWGTRGIGRCGLNNPLLSAHAAGAMVGYVDGHVGMMTKQTAPYLMKRLAMRDDGGEIYVDD